MPISPWSLHFTLFHLPLLLSAVVLVGLVGAAWRQRASLVAIPFLLIAALGAAWAVDYGLDIASGDLSLKLTLAALRVPIISGLAVTGLSLAARYARATPLSWRQRVALSVLPAASTALAFTSPRHTLWRYDYHVTADGPLPLLLFHTGWWYWLHATYLYVLIALALWLLLRAARDASWLYTRRMALMVAGLAISFVPSVLYDLGLTPLRGYNVAPSLFWVSGLIFAWGTIHERVLEVVPIARSLVMDQLRDAVLVFDPTLRVVDANRAAQHLLGRNLQAVIGQPVTTLLQPWGVDLQRLSARQPAQEQLTTGEGAARRVIDLATSAIERPRGRVRGHLLVLHDATDRERAKDAARAADALRAEREAEERTRRAIAEHLHGRVQNRLLLVWHRLGQLPAQWNGAPETVQRILEELRDEIDQIREQEIRLVSHRLYPSLLTLGLVPAVRSLVQTYESHLNGTLTVDPALAELDSLLDNRLSTPLRETAYRVVEEALGNVERHAVATRFNVTLGVNGSCLTIQVHDDGRGFDPAGVTAGLGLRTVAARVMNLGGEWQFVGAPSQGATLSVTLPLDSLVSGAGGAARLPAGTPAE